MGATTSSLADLAQNEYLMKLSGRDPIDTMDPFWNQLLSFSFLIPVNSSDSKLLEDSTERICSNFAINNTHTGNFGALVHNFLVRAAELKASAQCEDNIFIWQTYNALFIIRSFCKYFVEHLSEELVLQQFDCKPPGESVDNNLEGDINEVDPTIGELAEKLMSSLVELLVDVPVLNFTYALHLETLNTLLTLLSIQMFHAQPASKFTLYRFIMDGRCAIHAPVLIKALLWNYINQEKCPSELYKSSADGANTFYNVTAAVASSLWSVVTLGMGSSPKKKEEEFSETLLANQSLLFILVLANHCTSDSSLTNPYREALFAFTDSQDTSSMNPVIAGPTFKMDLSRLYSTLCSTLRDDQTTLLLYLLIHQNMSMKAFILSRTNIDQLVMPLLHILYQAQERNSHHIYMALIILLVLSEDEVFNKAVHEINLKNILWFKERPLTEISLGGLLILVVIRTVQFNMTRMRDKYLHTNCLAALANMSSQFANLHQFVAQKIVSLFAQLCKKHTRLVEQIRQVGAGEVEQGDDEDSEQIFMQDMTALQEVIRMVLEILNSCLTTSLHHNPNLIYTLLYNRNLFEQFHTHPIFQDIIQNIDTVLSFFSSRLEQNGKNLSPADVLESIKEGALQFRRDRLKVLSFFSSRLEQNGKNLSPADVLESIKEGALQFRRDRLKKFPELKFKYVEEDSPEEFFIPYIWSLVYHSSNMYFNATRIVLFSLSANTES